MGNIAIDQNKIRAMLDQLHQVAAKAAPPAPASSTVQQSGDAKSVEFGDVLKKSIDQVSQTDLKAQDLAKRFTTGDDTVSLSDVMISAQKANISLQTAVQVRNRLVTAYQTIMNMQI